MEINTRYVNCFGPPFQRGEQLGGLQFNSINKMLNLKAKLFSNRKAKWVELSKNALKIMENYAPTAYEELCGISKATGLKKEFLSMLAYEYEMGMSEDLLRKKCTGFLLLNKELLCGQTNDEIPNEWFNGKYDIIVSMKGEKNEPDCLFYTHPGSPAYFGMNSSGLCLLWQYIDNKERSLESGVPVTALIREVLTKKSLPQAIKYLKGCPRTVPNNFMLGQKGCSIANIECTPTEFIVTQKKKGYLIHANHILDERLKLKDIVMRNHYSTTFARYGLLENYFKKNEKTLTLGKIKNIYSKYPLSNKFTLLTMFCEPSKNIMHAKFNDSPDYQTFKM